MKLILLLILMNLTINPLGAERRDQTMDTMTMGRTLKTPQLEELMAGEKAAIKAYETILKRSENLDTKELRKIRDSHVVALKKLSAFRVSGAEEQSALFSPWATFSSAYAGGAKFIGPVTALRALKQGEEHGLAMYKKILDGGGLKPKLGKLIREELLPKQERHLKIINMLL